MFSFYRPDSPASDGHEPPLLDPTRGSLAGVPDSPTREACGAWLDSSTSGSFDLPASPFAAPPGLGPPRGPTGDCNVFAGPVPLLAPPGGGLHGPSGENEESPVLPALFSRGKNTPAGSPANLLACRLDIPDDLVMPPAASPLIPPAMHGARRPYPAANVPGNPDAADEDPYASYLRSQTSGSSSRAPNLHGSGLSSLTIGRATEVLKEACAGDMYGVGLHSASDMGSVPAKRYLAVIRDMTKATTGREPVDESCDAPQRTYLRGEEIEAFAEYIGMIPRMKVAPQMSDDDQTQAIKLSRELFKHFGKQMDAPAKSRIAQCVATMVTEVPREPHERKSLSSSFKQGVGPTLNSGAKLLAFLTLVPVLPAVTRLLYVMARHSGGKKEDKNSNKATKFLDEVLTSIPKGQISDEAFNDSIRLLVSHENQGWAIGGKPKALLKTLQNRGTAEQQARLPVWDKH